MRNLLWIFFYFTNFFSGKLQVDEYSNKVANYFSSLGYKKGDSVGLYMENRPEYVASWLGLAKIGVIPALINHNQKKQAFAHAVNVAAAKAIIYGSEFSEGAVF